jgi:Spy/CpxP family protein refolding chaperone
MDEARIHRSSANRPGGLLRRALVTGASVALLAAAGVGIAQSQAPATGEQPPAGCGHRHHDGDWKGRGGPLGHMAKELDLSDAQKQQIRDIFEQSRAEGEALRASLGGLHKELRDLVTSGGYTDDQARVIAQKYQNNFVDMTVQATRTMNQVRAVLTPEQQAKADAMGRKKGPWSRGFMGPLDGPPPGPPAG